MEGDVEFVTKCLIHCVQMQDSSDIQSLFELCLNGIKTKCQLSKKMFGLKIDLTAFTYEVRCQSIKLFCLAMYHLLEEAKEEDVNKDKMLNYVLENNLVVFMTGVCVDRNGNKVYRKVDDDITLFIIVYLMKKILKLKSYETTKHTKKLLYHNAIEILLDLISQKRKIPIFIASLDVLCCFCLNHREACERIIDAEGHLLLAPLLHKDISQKLMLSYGLENEIFELEGKCFEYQFYDIKCCIELSITNWCVPEGINQPLGLRLLYIGFEMKKAVMQIFMFIADMNNRYRMTLYNSNSCIKPLVAWLRNPSSDPSTHVMFQLASHVLNFMMVNEEVVLKLIKEYNFIDILDTGLYSAGWHISRQFQMLVSDIAKHKGTARDALASNKGIFKMLVCQIYSIDDEVQPCLMRLLIHLADSKKTAVQFHEAGFTPQVLIDTRHFYGHAYKDSIDQVRDGFALHVKSWRRVEKQTNKNYLNNIDERNLCREVEVLKARGNEYFKEGNFADASKKYSEALKICPVRIKCPDGDQCPSWNDRMKKYETNYHWWVIPATLFANRAQCHLKLENWNEVVSDCTKSICSCWIPCNEGGPARESIFFKAVYRRARAWYELKDYHKALNDISCCHELEPNIESITQFYKECLLLYRKKFGRELVRHCGTCGAGEGIDLRRCANCYEVYCSKKCQVMDWETGHHNLCEKINFIEC